MKNIRRIVLFTLTIALSGCAQGTTTGTMNSAVTQYSDEEQSSKNVTVEASESKEDKVLEAETAVYQPKYHYEIKKIGEFTADNRLNTHDGIFYSANNDVITLYGYDGNVILEGIKNYENIGKGLITTMVDNGSENCVGLYGIDGKKLIDNEAAYIKFVSCGNFSSDRFVEVIYSTGVTNDKDECVLFTTDRTLNLGRPNETDLMYKGYRKIYDLEKESFVDEIEIKSNDKYAV